MRKSVVSSAGVRNFDPRTTRELFGMAGVGKTDEFKFRPYVAPVMTPQYAADIRKVMMAHADANNSDPFAADRIALHMRRGLGLPSDVKRTAESQLNARQAAKMDYE